MALIVLTSAAGAPGCTTAALTMALGWPRRALFVEADPAGSSLVPGWLGGAYDGSRSLLNVAVGLTNGHRAADLITTQQVSAPEPFQDSTTTFLLGWLNPAQAVTAQTSWSSIGAALSQLDEAEVDVIVDAGRATQGSWPVDLLGYASQVLMVCRGTHVSAVRTAPTLNSLRGLLSNLGLDETLGLVVVGERDASAAEIASKLQVRLAATLPDDPKTARLFSDGYSDTLRGQSATRPRNLHRSALWTSARSAALAVSKAAQDHRRSLLDDEGDN